MRKAVVLGLVLLAATPVMAANVLVNGDFSTNPNLMAGNSGGAVTLGQWYKWWAPWDGQDTVYDSANGNPAGSLKSAGGGSQGAYQVVQVPSGVSVTVGGDWNVSSASWIEVMLFSYASVPTMTEVQGRCDTGNVADIAFKKEGYSSDGWVDASQFKWPTGNQGTVTSLGYIVVATKLGNGGTAFFDNLTATPEPVTMLLLGIPALFLRRRHA